MKKFNFNTEKEEYLTNQIITYIGNKRSLLNFIGESIKIVLEETKKDKLITADLFSGSGIVSRYLKQFSSEIYINDLENYANTINKCYMTNESEIDEDKINYWYDFLKTNLDGKLKSGFITKLYCPTDDKNIKEGERVFYTTRNGMYIDTARKLIDNIPEPYKYLFLAPLIYEASNKTNTSGVFKGFYKNSKTNIGQYGGNGRNALKRIMADINIEKPILSKYNCKSHIYQEDTVKLVKKLPHIDLMYLDPPYNQHPYSSNYFMLNLINDYKEPKSISKVSGIPVDWNKSCFNNKNESLNMLESICNDANASYILISFNSEGFITADEMVKMLSKYGNVRMFDSKYNTFRGCRNLKNRSKETKEFLFLLKKGENV